jgi:putative glycosyltransferase
VKISIVTTMYHSAAHLQEFYQRAKSEASKISPDLEVIFVNDGSPDESLKVALQLRESDPAIKIVDLSRNFGHHKALMVGLSFASGDLVFLIDCDLEEEPELLGLFYDELRKHAGVDVVYGVQSRRRGGLFDRFARWLYYRIISILSSDSLPANSVTARLMTRRYVQALTQFRESELVFWGLCLMAGFEQLAVPIEKRKLSASTYNLPRKLSLFIRSVTSFSDRPLRYIAYLGFFMFSIAVLYSIALIAIYLTSGRVPEGYTSLIISVWLLGGLIIFCIGIVAIYLSVVFVETKNRPYAVIRHVYGPNQNDVP